jgi:hypothetical protein
MENRHKDDRAKEQAGAQLASIEEMVLRLGHAEACSDLHCADTEEKGDERVEWHDEDEAREAITNDALSVQVRGEWHTPGAVDGAEPYAYKILLCWGGPSVQIVGTLDDHNQPDSARLQHQDWFTPWIDYPLTDEEEQTLIKYAQQFYFEG